MSVACNGLLMCFSFAAIILGLGAAQDQPECVLLSLPAAGRAPEGGEVDIGMLAAVSRRVRFLTVAFL